MAGMTRYSIESDIRTRAACALGLLSAICAFIINVGLLPWSQSAIYGAGFGGAYELALGFGVVGAIAPLALYGLSWQLLNKCLWKIGPINKLIGVPDLNGEWRGSATSSFHDDDNKPATYDMVLTITQDFDKIQCTVTSPNSSSESQTVGIRAYNPKNNSCYLDFSYENTAGAKSVEVKTWQKGHMGFNIIRCAGQTMEGDYFTNREPEQTSGHFTLHKVR